MKKAPAMDSSSGRALEQASRLDLRETGACGGDKILLKIWRKVSVFIGIYGGGIRRKAVQVGPTRAGGAPYPPGHAPRPCGPPTAPLDLSRSFLGPSLPKKIILNRQVILTPVDIDFLRNQKHAENRNWHWALN